MCTKDAAYFKIHPAIGVARMANNEDYFEFFTKQREGFPSETLMSPGQDGDVNPYGGPRRPRLKRQAVQFKVYAYSADHTLLGDINTYLPDLKVTWTAQVANRKLMNYSKKRNDGSQVLAEISATGSATGTLITDLSGNDPWGKGERISLGAISGTGLFIPAKSAVHSKFHGAPISAYPADQTTSLDTTDATCDGEISVSLYHNGAQVDVKVLPAWVVSAAPEHCFTLSPSLAELNKDHPIQPDFRNDRNLGWVKATKELLSIDGDLDDPTGMDIVAMNTMTAEYSPGMEVNLNFFSRRMDSEITNPDDVKSFFYPIDQDEVGKEIRVKRHSGNKGAKPGQLTSGLCSTWQGDMVECLNFWTAENPGYGYEKGTNISQTLNYKEGDQKRQFSTPEEINQYMDFRGIARPIFEGNKVVEISIDYDPNRKDPKTEDTNA